ncbi:MAG: MEMO1 family protein [Candidatus Micrarchaeota archaeon]|nr:MEMO1 family protein [Candidatus Micrarchaeota archaeon]
MRQPAVAGSFYPFSSSALLAQVKDYLSAAQQAIKPQQRLAIVCPHAGYIYSGRCAAHSYASCANWKEKELTAVVIGPNHTGMGAPISVSFEDWQTPLGRVECDAKLAEEIVKAGKIARKDELAHLNEHSAEVQLPFLQVCAPQAKMVGICMGWQDYASAADLGGAIFSAASRTGRNIIVIASSDFTHYEPADRARQKDMKAIELLLELDEAGFEEVVEERGLSICGHGPIAAAVYYAKLAKAKKCELLKYTNSGEQTGDYGSVVAYAALAISK